MTNNKQQTAVEWYAGRHHDLEGLRDFGAISIVEYYEELTKAVQQAKEIEKDRMMQFARYVLWKTVATMELTIEQHYEQTYGGGEQ
jgi:hypothetical protein